MSTTQLQAQRGHSPPSRPYEVTRSYLAKAEEMLQLASEHVRKEAPGEVGIERVKILSLVIASRRLRRELEGA